MTLQQPLIQSPDTDLLDAVAKAFPALDAPWQQLEGGRVNTLWRVGDIVIKQFQETAASPLFPNDPAAEADALRLLAPLGLAPNLLAQGEGWLAYSYTAGSTWRDDPAKVAIALRQLHQLNAPQQAFRKGPNGSAELLEQAKGIASLCTSALPAPPPDISLPPGPTSLIHGDAVPGNVIVHEGRITLIDWQCPAIGDPAEDLATFLSPAMQWLYRGNVLTPAEVNIFRANSTTETLARYDRLAPIYHWRMAAHCLWKAEANKADYAQAMQLELCALERLAQNNAP